MTFFFFFFDLFSSLIYLFISKIFKVQQISKPELGITYDEESKDIFIQFLIIKFLRRVEKEVLGGQYDSRKYVK